MKKWWLITGILVFLPFLFILFKTDKQTAILFIGNSYTYRNDMPGIFEQIAASKGKNVYVEHCTKGKATFIKQAARDEVFVAIKSRKWDFIIIQGSSRDLIKDSSILYGKSIPALKKILDAIKKYNPSAKKLFYMTWAYRNGFKPIEDANSYSKMSQKVQKGYLNLKNMFHIGVVPVGCAWDKVRSENSNIVLYVSDGSHPSLKGSYLAACCFYTAIFDEPVKGANFYSKLGPETCGKLQDAATETVQSKKDLCGLCN